MTGGCAENCPARADLKAALSRLAATRANYACLLAACRASVAAAAAGAADPIVYVRGLLEDRGQLPAPGAVPRLVLADARSALTLTGWDAPKVCPGCVGRGTGTRCCRCGGDIPEALRRKPGDRSELASAGAARPPERTASSHAEVSAS
jgi:hypothetical protein